MPVGMCVIRTAESVVLTLCPPGPEDRKHLREVGGVHSARARADRHDGFPLVILPRQEGADFEFPDGAADGGELTLGLVHRRLVTLLLTEFDEHLKVVDALVQFEDAVALGDRPRECGGDLLGAVGVVPQVGGAGLGFEVRDGRGQAVEIDDLTDRRHRGAQVADVLGEVASHDRQGYVSGLREPSDPPRRLGHMPESSTSTFADLLRAQVRNEFTASQQYIALAVWFDDHDLPRLAAHFYRQSVEEHNHAMMFVQYLLDRDLAVAITGIDQVLTDFSTPREPIELALSQEKQVTAQVEALFRAARHEDDALGEQFMMWFLKEQVGDNGIDPSAPPAAGGAL